MCLCLSVRVVLCLCVCVCVYAWLSVSVCLSVCLSVGLSVFPVVLIISVMARRTKAFVCELCMMRGSFVYCVEVFYVVWELCVLWSFVYCVEILCAVWELCIVCGSFVYCMEAFYDSWELCILCVGMTSELPAKQNDYVVCDQIGQGGRGLSWKSETDYGQRQYDFHLITGVRGEKRHKTSVFSVVITTLGGVRNH